MIAGSSDISSSAFFSIWAQNESSARSPSALWYLATHHVTVFGHIASECNRRRSAQRKTAAGKSLEDPLGGQLALCGSAESCAVCRWRSGAVSGEGLVRLAASVTSKTSYHSMASGSLPMQWNLGYKYTIRRAGQNGRDVSQNSQMLGKGHGNAVVRAA